MFKRILSLILTFNIILSPAISRLPHAFATTISYSTLQLSDAGISYLKKEEGFSSKPYWDYSQYTVGYGSKCPDEKLDEYRENGISKEDAEALLKTHITSFESDVNNFININSLTLSQNQFDMLVCFSYNVGSAWLSDATSELRKDILNGSIGSSFVRNLVLWSKAGGNRLDGLVKRRLRDANMYLNGDYTANSPSTLGCIYYAPNGGTVKNNVQGFIFNEVPSPIEVPSWPNHEFMGWYTEQIGGQKVEKLTKDLNGKTLYAHWDAEKGLVPEPIKPINVKVTGDSVNLREGCGTNYKIIGQVKRNDILTITEIGEGSGYTWGKSEKGWISLAFTNYNDVISGKVQEPSKDETPEITEPEPTPPEPTEHIHKYNSSIVSPTCDKSGYTKYSCECGDTYTDSSASAHGHSFGEWQEVEKPTSTTEGSEKRICSRCEKEETRKINKLPEPTSPSIPEQSDEEHSQTVIDRGTVKVNDYLAIRSGVGTNFKEVGQLYNENRVEIYEIVTKNTVRWGKIKTGWICLNYIALDSEPVVKPDTNHNNILTVQNPIPDTPKQDVVADISVPCYGIVTVKDVLYVRLGPSISYLAIDSLRNGSNVEILEVKNSNGVRWGCVGENRWINLNYVKIEEDLKLETIVENELVEMIPDKPENVELSVNLIMEEDIESLDEEAESSKEVIEETQSCSETEPISTTNTKINNEENTLWIVKIFGFIVDTLMSLFFR